MNAERLVKMVPSASTDFAACLRSAWRTTIVSLATSVEMAHVFQDECMDDFDCPTNLRCNLVSVNLTLVSRTRTVRGLVCTTVFVCPVMNV